MGNTSSMTKFYSNSDIKIENHIRDFELELGFFRYDFNLIFSKLFIDEYNNDEKIDFTKINYYSDNSIKIIKNNVEIKKLNTIIQEFYPPKLLNFLDKPYFKTKDFKYYDIKRIQFFIFLISNDSSIRDIDSGYYFQNKVI